mgnify:CR=1 FL=1
MDLVKLNDFDSIKAHFILNDLVESGRLIKEVRGHEDIIYHVNGVINDHELVYDIRFEIENLIGHLFESYENAYPNDG